MRSDFNWFFSSNADHWIVIPFDTRFWRKIACQRNLPGGHNSLLDLLREHPSIPSVVSSHHRYYRALTEIEPPGHKFNHLASAATALVEFMAKRFNLYPRTVIL